MFRREAGKNMVLMQVNKIGESGTAVSLFLIQKTNKIMLDYIRELDHQLLIFINQLGNTGWDSFWLTITNAWNWIPFFLLILFVVFKKFSRREVKWILFYFGLTFFFTAMMTFLPRWKI